MKKAAVCVGSLAVASGKIHFSETFGEGWESRWTASKWKESEGTAGSFVASAGKWFKDEAEDTGIQTGQDSRFFGLSAGFDSFSNAGKDLIIQYQAKYEKDVECGGGYVKVGPKMSDPTTFGDPTPYNIMFGPDKCGYNKRTHLIFSYKGKNVLKKTDLPYKQDGEGTSHVYRVIVKPDNTVKVEIDQEKVYEGSLKEDWEVLAPKEISDPDDKKPEDWADEAMIESAKEELSYADQAVEVAKQAWLSAKTFANTSAFAARKIWKADAPNRKERKKKRKAKIKKMKDQIVDAKIFPSKYIHISVQTYT